MSHYAILLAGGKSQRMDGIVPDKIIANICGKPVFSHVLDRFEKSEIVENYIIVYRDETQRMAILKIIETFHSDFKISRLSWAIGGNTRSASVRSGLSMLPNHCQYVYVHDCARPAINPKALSKLREKLLDKQTALSLAKPAIDTIKEFESHPGENLVTGKTLDRSKLWIIETPQAFPKSLLIEAHATGIDATDDLAAVENLGKPIGLVENPDPNPKLTQSSDFITMETLLKEKTMEQRASFRIGYGYDIHRFSPARELILGGVKIQADFGLNGHSDADVLSHAIADAILGAVGLPDIGHHFPNTDPTIQGISSLKILQKAQELALNKGYAITNIDATLVAERPKVSPYIKQIKECLAQHLSINHSQIGIKATTNEKLGSLGAGEGMAAQAAVLMNLN